MASSLWFDWFKNQPGGYTQAELPYWYGIQYGKPGAGAGVVVRHRLWEVAVQHAHPIPLVGRDAEQSALALALRTAKQGAFRCIVIDGEPGIGKTRLAIARGYQGLRRMRLQMAS
jgi:AAA ATPase domain